MANPNEIVVPGSRLFSSTDKYAFKDAINTLNYTLMIKKVGAANASKVRCLAPHCQSIDQQTEWKKAMFVQLVLNLVNSGSDLSCIPDACSCDDFAACICQDSLLTTLGV